MHPVIRIINLFIIAAFAPWVPPYALAAAAALMLLVAAVRRDLLVAMASNLRRVRWLLVSIAVLFLFFTPGEPLLAEAGRWSPTEQGMLLAVHRALVLVVMVWAATMLLLGLEPRDLSGTIRRLLGSHPRLHGLHRFGDRIGLVFAELPQVQARVGEALAQRERPFFDRAAQLVVAVERAADDPLAPLSPRDPGRVPFIEWIVPSLLAATGVLLVVL